MQNHNQKYVMRAPPRRRTKGDEPEDQPLFLRKAFAMISSCPPEIGGWSEKGDTVIIRDVKQFAEKVIPTAYKHNNFSSFVRQLNFYGFRKVKSESMEHTDWWEFRHPQFLRDEPNLLSEIKRSVHFSEPNNGQEVNELRSQVTGLNERIAAMHEQIDRLTGIVSGLQLASAAASPSVPNDAQKKRKLGEGARAGAAPMLLRRQSSTDSTVMIGEYQAAGAVLPNGPDLMGPEGDLFRWNTDADADDMGLLFSLMDEDVPTTSSSAAIVQAPMVHIKQEPTPLPQPQAVLPMAQLVSSAVPDSAPTAAAIGAVSAAANDISSVLDGLSPELRLRFVDRLAEVMGAQLTQNIAQQVQVQVHVSAQQEKEAAAAAAPLSLSAPVAPAAGSQLQLQVPAVPAHFPVTPSYGQYQAQTGSSSSTSDPSQFRLPSGSKAPEIAIPLASAAIAALLSSMQAFAHNPQLLNTPAAHVKDELSCK